MSISNTVVLSIDAELIWGFQHRESIPTERVEHARESWRYLVDLFEEYRIPATWAIVGHLFLEECDGTHETHPAAPEWFARDPGETLSSKPNWFGTDVIDAVLDSSVDHEIGSHSFSHIEFGRPETTAEIAAAELGHFKRATVEYDLEFDSFVFPRNSIAHRELLAEHGYSCYRGPTPDRWYDGTPVRRAGKFATYAFGMSAPPIVIPEIDEYGLVNVPASMSLFTFEGYPRKAIETIGRDPVVQQVKNGLESLANSKEGVLHLWLHPNNITTNRDRERIERIFTSLIEYRSRYNIQVETMGSIAKRL